MLDKEPDIDEDKYNNTMWKIEEFYTGLVMIIKFPLRLICKFKKKHEWIYDNGCFLYNYKYKYICKTCGVRCKDDKEVFTKYRYKGEDISVYIKNRE